MKPAVYICLGVMLFLMAQPVIINCREKAKACRPVKSSCGGNTCSAKSGEENSDPDERMPQDGCNPFAACSQCHFTAILSAGSLFAFEAETGKKISLYNEGSCSDFVSDCWNPPELAQYI